MRVLVCGSRTFNDPEFVNDLLYGLCARWVHEVENFGIIEGGARGADRLAAEFAELHGLGDAHEQYPANWGKHGKRAGFIRNQEMIDTEPDLVLAFIDKPLEDSRGTQDTVLRAKRAGIETYVIRRY